MPPPHISCPPGANGSKGPKGPKPPKGGGKGSGAPAVNAAAAKRIKDLERQLGEAQKECKEAKKAQPPATEEQGEGDGSEGTSKSATDKNAAKETQKRMANIRSMEPGLQKELCAPYGGYEVYMRKLEKQLHEERVQQRGQKPLGQQRASADAHQRKMQKAKDEIVAKREKAQSQFEQLAKDIENLDATCLEAEAKLQEAKDALTKEVEAEASERRVADGRVRRIRLRRNPKHRHGDAVEDPKTHAGGEGKVEGTRGEPTLRNRTYREPTIEDDQYPFVCSPLVLSAGLRRRWRVPPEY